MEGITTKDTKDTKRGANQPGWSARVWTALCSSVSRELPYTTEVPLLRTQELRTSRMETTRRGWWPRSQGKHLLPIGPLSPGIPTARSLWLRTMGRRWIRLPLADCRCRQTEVPRHSQSLWLFPMCELASALDRPFDAQERID